ncbi:hypothetical protein ACFV0T_28205 [Streptomyces sp. NPDC059582]|uniref:hypothetical protein n=1 Tax=Streptomyces sp. NPDC059582 TaxID=3346875 RepID=UPI0036BB873E
MPSDPAAPTAAPPVRVAELDMIYGAMLGCLEPQPATARAAAPADRAPALRPDYRALRAHFQTDAALWFQQPAF